MNIQGNWTANHRASAWRSYFRLRQLISACELSPAHAGVQHAAVDGLLLEAVLRLQFSSRTYLLVLTGKCHRERSY